MDLRSQMNALSMPLPPAWPSLKKGNLIARPGHGTRVLSTPFGGTLDRVPFFGINSLGSTVQRGVAERRFVSSERDKVSGE